jgi:hypothetical protein
MFKKIIIALFFHFMCVIYIYAQLRAFNDIFPNLSRNERSAVFNETGYVKTLSKSGEFDIAGSNRSAIGIDSVILNTVLSMNPGYIVESISVISENPEEVTLLDVYNSLGNIRNLKGRLYNSHSRKQLVPLFEDATRITSEKKYNPNPRSAAFQISSVRRDGFPQVKRCKLWQFILPRGSKIGSKRALLYSY